MSIVTVFDRLGTLPLIGRTGPAQLLGRAVANAKSGDQGAFLLLGEAGIGKTRLIRETVRETREHGHVALHAECIAEPGAPPYDVWIRALRSLPGRSPRDILERSVGSAAHAPQMRNNSGQKVTEDSFRFFANFLEALENVASRQPLVIFLDDLQWAEPSSLQLFQFVAMNARATPLVLIGAARSDEMPPDGSLEKMVDDLVANQRATRIDLNPLSQEETGAYVEMLLGKTAANLATLLHANSEGNPFVLEEAIRVLATTGDLTERLLYEPDLKLSIPPSVSASITSRIDRLSASDRDVLEAGAVAGKRFSVDILTAALEMERGLLDEPLEALCRLSLLQRDGNRDTGAGSTYVFLHDRIRDVVLTVMQPARAERLHLNIAEALQNVTADGADPDRIGALAHHFQMAGEPCIAAEYFGQLGDLSMTRNAPDDAASAYRSALALYRQAGVFAPDTTPLQFALGKALLAMGKLAAVDSFRLASDQFLSAGLNRRAAEAAEHAAIALSANEDHQQALASYQFALDLLAHDQDASQQRASVLVHMSESLGMGAGRFHDAMRAQRKALELLTPGGRRTANHSRASLALARTLMRINRLSDASAVIEEALPSMLGAGDLVVAAELEGALANVRYWQGDVRASRLCTLRRQHYAESAGDFFSRRHISAWLALLEVATGNWEEAGRLLDQSEEQASLFDSPEPIAFTRQIRGHLAFSTGDYEGACTHFDAAITAFRRMGAATSLWYLGYAARSFHIAGQHERSQAVLAEAQITLEELHAQSLPSGASLTELALLAVDAESSDQYQPLYDALAPYSGQLHWHLIDRARGLLALAMDKPAQAARHFGEASMLARAFGLRSELAAIKEHRAAAGIPDATPAEPSSDHVTEAAAPIRQHRPAGLTAREVEILRLVASGLTNKQIAVRLAISDKTVTNHITHIFDKADLANRAAAAAFAVRHRLI